MPTRETLSSISPAKGDSLPRTGRSASLVREKLGTALGLKPYLWVPRVIHRTPLGDKGDDGSLRVALSVHNGTIVGQSTISPHKNGKYIPWVYPRGNAPFTRCEERVGLHQRMLRHLASFGLQGPEYKIIKRIFKVGFQVPIKHLRKMVRSVVLSCHNSCCKKHSQPLVTGSKGRSIQYPSLTGETKSIVKYGITVPLWNPNSGFTAGIASSFDGRVREE